MDHSAFFYFKEANMDTQKIITPLEAFREFYQLMQSQPMSESEENVIADIITQINE